MNDSIIILGAGPVGLFLAIKLAQAGLKPHVIEKREKLKLAAVSTGITLSDKGKAALEGAGVWEVLQGHAHPLSHRATHYSDNTTQKYPYSAKGGIMYSMERSTIVGVLFEKCKELGVKISFGATAKILSFSPCNLEIIEGGSSYLINPLFVFSVDGAYSKTRRLMQKRPYFNVSIQFSEQSYVSVALPIPEGTSHDAVNYWVGKDYNVLGLPGKTGSGEDFIMRTTLLYERKTTNISTLVQTIISDYPLFASYKNILDEAVENRGWEEQGWPMLDVKCDPWGFGKVLLLGDAATATQPILGQGLNLGFHTVCTLVNFIENSPKWIETIHTLIVPDLQAECSAVQAMSKQVANEVHKAIKDPNFGQLKIKDVQLAKNTPNFIRQYDVMAYTLQPYSFALTIGEVNWAIITHLMDIGASFEEDQTELVKQFYQATKYGPTSVWEYLQQCQLI